MKLTTRLYFSAALVMITASFFVISVKSFAEPDIKIVAAVQQGQIQAAPKALSKVGLQLKSNIELAEAGDYNGNGSIDSGEMVRYSFTLQNTSAQSSRSVTVDTGILKADVLGIQDITGVTGYVVQDGKVRLTNIVVEAGQTKAMSFKAYIVLTNTDRKLIYHPALIDATKAKVLEGSDVTYTVGGQPDTDAAVHGNLPQPNGAQL